MRLYLLWVIGIAILLMVGDPTVRTLAALVLVVGAWPLIALIRQAVKHEVWQEVETTVSASDEPDLTAPSSGLD